MATSKKGADSLLPYETTFITKTELSDSALGQIKDRVLKAIAQFGGEVIVDEDAGKRRLAYPIKKETRGQYTYLAYTGKAGVVKEIERNLRIQEHVLRFLTVNLGKDFNKDDFVKNRLPFGKGKPGSEKRLDDFKNTKERFY